MKPNLIPFQDYKRIFNIIYSILVSEDAELNHSCTYYSIIGASILRDLYKVEATVSVGLAAFMVDASTEDVLVFAENENGNWVSSETGFHSWIEAEGWIIDFSTPLFPKILESMGRNSKCGAKMFQKHINKMTNSPMEFKSTGDFFCQTNCELSNQLIDQFFSYSVNQDFIEICKKWHKKPPKKIQKQIHIVDDTGNLKKVNLQTMALSGSW